MKNINLSLSFATLKKAFFAFLHRFHVVIFVIIVVGGLALSILILNAIIIRSSDTSGVAPSGGISFDQATIKRIDELKTPDQTGANLDLSNGRTNPFVE